MKEVTRPSVRIKKWLRRRKGLCDRYMEWGMTCRLPLNHEDNCIRER